jgi:apolipoprotein D and lipocalin family protein
MQPSLYAAAVSLFLATGCQSMPPIHTVSHLDLNRFMGKWYVIASIPTFIERDVHNGIESYRLDPDGTIQTTFTFNKGGFDGPLKTYRPRGFVRDTQSNAVWGMQFLWPFKAEYRVIYLNEDYTHTVIGRTKRDYVWIMAREPSIPGADFERIVAFIADEGYDISKLVEIPHEENRQ